MAAATRHHLRNALLGLGGFLLVLLVGLAACELAQWPFLRHPLERQLAGALQRPVELGDHFGVRFLGHIRGHADTLVIGPGPAGAPALLDEQGRPRDFLRANDVRLALDWRTVWQHLRHEPQPLQVRELVVDGLELNLERDAAGRANWQFGAASSPTPQAMPELPRFATLRVRHGQLRVEDVPLQITAEATLSTNEGTAVEAAAADASAASAAAVQQATAASAPSAVNVSVWVFVGR